VPGEAASQRKGRALARPWRRRDNKEKAESNRAQDDRADSPVDVLSTKEHAWWATRENLERPYAPPREEVAEKKRSPFWEPESLFSYEQRPPDDIGWPAAEGIGPDPYEVLGLPLYATWDQIVSAHRHLAKQFHPDRFVGAPDEERAAAEERMRDVNQAYDELRRQRGSVGSR
jgi:hypothetical protein